MNFKILWEHLSDPEYVHVLINEEAERTLEKGSNETGK